MNIIGDIFNLIFLGPVINLLVLIYHFLSGLRLPGAVGFSIMLLTVAIRALIWPFIASQMKSTRKMAELRPHLAELQKKHKDDKQAMAQAQMALYKEHGINPAGGCLPSLIQLPMVIALYQTIYAMFGGVAGLSKINAFLYNSAWRLNSAPDLNFFGVNLATKPSAVLATAPVLLLIPIITGLLQFAQSRMMTPAPVKVYPSDSPKEVKEKEKTEDTMAAVQSQMMFMMPLMIGYFSFSFPVGISIYWNTFTVLGIVQQYRISGWGGLSPWIRALPFVKS